MIDWPELSDAQLEIAIAHVLGHAYWANRRRVWDLISNRHRDPSWTIIDTLVAA